MQTLMHVLAILRSVFVNIIRFFFWIGHFAIRLLARLALLFTLAGTIIIPALIAVVLIYGALPDILQWVEIERQIESIRVLAFLVTLGAFATLSTFFARVIIASLRTLIRNSLKTLGNEWIQWIPAWTRGEGLPTTRQQIAALLPKMWETFKASWMLVLSVLIGAIVLMLAYVQTEDSAKWQEGITTRLEILEDKQSTLEEDFTNWQGEVKEMHLPLSDPLEEPLVVYSLAYRDQGDRESKKGICPDPMTSEWLNEFKAAIAKYSRGDESRLQLEVRGFSSVAPVAEAGSRNRSNQLNREIANERAEAVVGFLTSGDSCEKVFSESKDSKWKRQKNNRGEFKFGIEEGLDFDVTYRPWQSYEEMTRHKPINDGPSGGQRRPAVEFLSRAVQIIVKNALR